MNQLNFRNRPEKNGNGVEMWVDLRIQRDQLISKKLEIETTIPKKKKKKKPINKNT